MSNLLVFLLPTFVLGLILRSFLLKVHESRLSIWVFSFGVVGASSWCTYVLAMYPREDFYFILAFHELFAVFLFSCACGFVFWFYNRKSGYLLNPESGTTEARGNGHAPSTPHVLIFIRLLLAYGVAIFAAIHILIFIFVLMPGIISGYSPPALTLYERAMLNLPSLMNMSYGFGFPCLVAAHFLTLHLLQTNEKRLLIWVGFYLALFVVVGFPSMLLASDWIFRTPYYALDRLSFFSGTAFVAAILTGALMWIFAGSLRSDVSLVSQYELLPDRDLRSSVLAMGPLHLAGAAILLFVVLLVPAVLTIHRPFQLFIFLIFFSQPLVLFAGIGAFLAGLGERRLGVWLVTYAILGVALWSICDIFRTPFRGIFTVFAHNIIDFMGFFAAVGVLQCLFFERQALKRRDVPGSPYVLSRRAQTLFCGRVFLNLISAFCLVVIFGLSLMRYFDSNYVYIINPDHNIYHVISERLFLALFSLFYPFVLIFFVSLSLIKRNIYSLWLWILYYGAVGGITVALQFLLFFAFNPRPDFFAENYIFLVLAFMALMGTGVLVWVFFVRKILKERRIGEKFHEIEGGVL